MSGNGCLHKRVESATIAWAMAAYVNSIDALAISVSGNGCPQGERSAVSVSGRLLMWMCSFLWDGCLRNKVKCCHNSVSGNSCPPNRVKVAAIAWVEKAAHVDALHVEWKTVSMSLSREGYLFGCMEVSSEEKKKTQYQYGKRLSLQYFEEPLLLPKWKKKKEKKVTKKE